MAKILIVDDAASMLGLIEITLKNEGHEVVSASDGVLALAKLDGTYFDLIITDLNMPNMNGVEFIKAAKAKSDYKFTPIVMLTTESRDNKKQEGKDAGAKAWIVKPFKPDTLLGVVRKILG